MFQNEELDQGHMHNHRNRDSLLRKKKGARQWWSMCTPLGRQRQENLCECQNTQAYTEKHCLMGGGGTEDGSELEIWDRA